MSKPPRKMARALEDAWQSLVFGFARFALRGVSTRRQLAFYASHRQVVQLDFEGSELWMRVSSPKELGRARACAKEPETVAWLTSRLREGDVVFDIGANVGAYAMIAARLVGPKGRVVAIEPGPASYGSLLRNLHLNKLENVTALPIAATNANGLALLRFQSDQAGETICFAPGHKPEFDISAMAFTLDRLLEAFDLPCPKLLKIDTDGFEVAVLEGAKGILANPALESVLVEAFPEAATTPEALRLVEEGGLRLFSRHPHGAGRVINYIYSRP